MILVSMEDGRGVNPAGEKIYINPEQVTGLEMSGPDTTSLRTTSYVWLVKGNIEKIAAILMMPEMMDRAGLTYDKLDDFEELVKEKFG
jgi:hypothetical protein